MTTQKPMGPAMREMMEEMAEEYRDNDFERNPEGYSISTYCNSETTATAFEAGFTAAHAIMQDRIERLTEALANAIAFEDGEQVCEMILEAIEAEKKWSGE